VQPRAHAGGRIDIRTVHADSRMRISALRTACRDGKGRAPEASSWGLSAALKCRCDRPPHTDPRGASRSWRAAIRLHAFGEPRKPHLSVPGCPMGQGEIPEDAAAMTGTSPPSACRSARFDPCCLSTDVLPSPAHRTKPYLRASARCSPSSGPSPARAIGSTRGFTPGQGRKRWRAATFGHTAGRPTTFRELGAT